jgi:hypothetical protein
VVASSVRVMASGRAATWRTTYCTVCRRARRHFTTSRGETCSWCGNVREEARQPAYGTSVRHSASSWNAAS